jgi:short-subunit dehydrogenase
LRLRDKIVVITGASGGIGRALAIEAGLSGAIVHLAARSSAGLEQCAGILGGYGIRHSLSELDVTSLDSIKELRSNLQSRYRKVDVLINNAGIGLFQRSLDASDQDLTKIFETNTFGPLRLTRELKPLLAGGMVVNISSAASKFSPADQGVYAASKAAFERFSEALSVEEDSFRTLLVVPDRTDTPFMANVIGPKTGARLALDLKPNTAEAVAKSIVAAIQKERRICYTTLKARAYTILSATAPALVRRLVEKTA